MEQAIVSAITPDTSEAKITIAGVPDRPGVAGSIFRALADEHANVDLIVQNTSADGVTDISFTVPRDDLDRALRVCRELGGSVGATGIEADESIARVSVIGAGMKSNPGVAATMFETLAAARVNILMISTSPIRISCVIAETDIERAVEALHDAYDLANSTH